MSAVWTLRSHTIHWADQMTHASLPTSNWAHIFQAKFASKARHFYKQWAPGFCSAAFREDSVLHYTASMQTETLQRDHRQDQKEAHQMVLPGNGLWWDQAQKEHTDRLHQDMKLIEETVMEKAAQKLMALKPNFGTKLREREKGLQRVDVILETYLAQCCVQTQTRYRHG